MDTKLTLKLDANTIEQAKTYANIHKISLSKIVEQYFEELTKNIKTQSATNIVDSLSGIIDLPNDYSYKADIANSLSNKYK